MRPIKFRIWSKETKKMLYYEDVPVPCLTLNGVLQGENHTNVSYKYELEQFTGLCDKNGKEGYPSDKVSFGSTRPTYLIKWSISNAGFYLESMDERKERLVISNLLVGEIIGNIHSDEEAKDES